MIGALGSLFNAFVMRMIQSLMLPWGPREGANGQTAAFVALGNNAVASIGVQPFQAIAIDVDQPVVYIFTSGQAPPDPATRAAAGQAGWRSLRAGYYRRIVPPGCTAVHFVGIAAAGYADVQRLPSEVGEKGDW